MSAQPTSSLPKIEVKRDLAQDPLNLSGAKRSFLQRAGDHFRIHPYIDSFTMGSIAFLGLMYWKSRKDIKQWNLMERVASYAKLDYTPKFTEFQKDIDSLRGRFESDVTVLRQEIKDLRDLLNKKS